MDRSEVRLSLTTKMTVAVTLMVTVLFSVTAVIASRMLDDGLHGTSLELLKHSALVMAVMIAVTATTIWALMQRLTAPLQMVIRHLETLSEKQETDILAHLEKSGSQQFPYPVSGNKIVNGQPITAVVTRWENTVRPTHNGHHVTYDLPAVKHQYGCFLQNLAEGRTPIIIQGSEQGGPCL